MISTVHRHTFSLALPARPMMWLYSAIAVHFALVWGLQVSYGLPMDSQIMGLLLAMMTGFLPIFVAAVVLVKLARFAATPKALRAAARPSQALLAEFRTYLGDRPAVAESAVTLAFMVLFFDAFTRFKAMIPQLNPFSWDMPLAQLDRALHGGIDPWVWLHPLTQHPAVMKALDLGYVVWFVMLYIAVFLALFARGNTANRRAFLIAFVLVWALGGNALALMFSSAGPVFFAQIGLGDMFAPLNAQLAQISGIIPLTSDLAKAAVWDGYANGGAIASIAAFPSMHVGSTALITLFAFSYRPWAGWAMSVYLGMILAGSIALAWHYAVDGYAGILLAYLSWRAGQRLAARADSAN